MNDKTAMDIETVMVQVCKCNRELPIPSITPDGRCVACGLIVQINRACHSPPASEPMVSIPLSSAEYFAEIGRKTAEQLQHVVAPEVDILHSQNFIIRAAIAKAQEAK
jgi:hypothetical protein